MTVGMTVSGMMFRVTELIILVKHILAIIPVLTLSLFELLARDDLGFKLFLKYHNFIQSEEAS